MWLHAWTIKQRRHFRPLLDQLDAIAFHGAPWSPASSHGVVVLRARSNQQKTMGKTDDRWGSVSRKTTELWCESCHSSSWSPCCCAECRQLLLCRNQMVTHQGQAHHLNPNRFLFWADHWVSSSALANNIPTSQADLRFVRLPKTPVGLHGLAGVFLGHTAYHRFCISSHPLRRFWSVLSNLRCFIPIFKPKPESTLGHIKKNKTSESIIFPPLVSF